MSKPGRRTYGQYCALAVSLDLVGERWTMLIIRELLVRPRRYAELLHALPGIGTNLLAERMRYLIEVGLVRTVNDHDRRSGYELTERGEALRETVVALARWGLETMAHQAQAGHVTPGWAQLGVEALIDNDRAPGMDEDYTVDVEGEVFTIAVRHGRAAIRPGPSPTPAIIIATDALTLIDIGARKLDPIAALVSERLVVTGAPEAMLRCLRLLGLHADSDDSRAEHQTQAKL